MIVTFWLRRAAFPLFFSLLVSVSFSARAATSLIHRYSFTSDANDSIGSADASLVGGAILNNGSVELDGSSGYVNLPNGIVSTLDSVTLEMWVVDDGSGTWARLFDFGNSTAGEDGAGTGVEYLFLTPQGGSGALRGAITQSSNGGEQLLEWSGTRLPIGVLKHVVWTSDSATTTGRLYVDGALVAENPSMSLRPSDMGDTVNNWLGRSQWINDPYLNGSITEFRIYDGALTAEEVQENYEYGPDVVALGGPATFITEPVSQTVGESQPVSFSVSYSGLPPVNVQWYRGSSAIAGATNDTYTIPSVSLAEHNASFHVVLSNNVSGTPHTVTSSNAVLTVTADTAGPVLVRAASLYPDGVLVEFNEGVDDVTGADPDHYQITYDGGTLAVTGAAFGGSDSNIVLTTAAQSLNTLYTLTVNQVRDRSAAGNEIATDSQATFAATPYVSDDIGNPGTGGTLTAVSGGVDLTGGGAGIGDTSDQFTFSHRSYSGDFDVQVRLAALERSATWARAGLMARDGLTADALFAASLVTAGPGGCYFGVRSSVGAAATMAGSFPPNYPDTWLRLRRTGDLFEGMASLDGQTWQLLGSATINMASTVEVGFALTAGDDADSTTAQFRDAGSGSGPVVQSIDLPFEPMGPCSRRTPLVISEIMYDAPSAWGGTNSLEFVELWNSGLITEDLTGHRLAGEISYTFPDGTKIAPGQFLVVAKDPAAAQSFYGIPFLGPYTNKLSNSGGSLRLLNELGGRLLDVEYDNKSPWPAAANGTGHSLVLSRPSYGEADPRAWSASDVIGGSPGAVEHFGVEPARQVVINEFLAHTDDPELDYIELFNAGPQPVDLSGAWLSDEAGTNKFRIPDHTTIEARDFLAYDQNELGFALSADGETILLVNSNQTRVLDAVDFRGQANGVTSGRYPDGAPGFQELSTVTKGAANTGPLLRPVVINEIMYHPISESNNDEYLELYNRSGNAVDLSLWRIQGGVSYEFPSNTVIAAHAYLVVAENRANLMAKYVQLNATNTFGDYSGNLSDKGERVTLAMPEDLVSTNAQGIWSTNIYYIPVDEVSYLDGGRWGRWSDGGGSSLELQDPDADNRQASSWADSDESEKAAWTTIDVTNILENGQSSGTVDEGGYYGQPNRFEVFMQGAGEALVDNLEFHNNNGANLINNGDFSGGISGWTFGGVLRGSFVENGVGAGGSAALHLMSVDRGDTGPNKVFHGLASTATIGGANTGTMRAQVRWLRGSPYTLLRLRGNWMEVSQRLNVPSDCGTPGMVNSRRIANAGPVITDISPSPILPAAGQEVVIRARVADVDGVLAVSLRYRLDSAGSYASVAMLDNGTGGDAVAGDGIYSGIIPGQSSGTMVAFTIQANDTGTAVSLFPAESPVRECLVHWGESVIPGSLGTYRLWLTSSNINVWTARERNANDPLDATFVYGNSRVIYNVDTLYSGSPFHTPAYNGPLSSIASDYEVNFYPDEKFLGSEPFVLTAYDVYDGNFFFNDDSAQVDLTGTWIARKLGQPYNYRRHVNVVMNGQRRGTIYDDAQQPNSEMLDEYFFDDSDGELRKVESWFEFADNGQTQGSTYARIGRVNTSTGQVDTKRYRWNWRPRVTRNPDRWFAFTNLVAAVNDTGAPDYESRVRTWMDVRDFLRPVAVHHICGSWDSYAYDRGKNMYAYKPDDGKWRLMMWDIELALGAQGNAPTDDIYRTRDDVLFDMITSVPAFHREYLQAFQEAVDTALAPGVADVILDERYANLRQNGIPVVSPQFIKNFISQRRSYLQGILPNASFGVDGASSLTVSSNSVTLTGSAPLTVYDILVDGVAYPVEWTDVTRWRIRLPLNVGLNTLGFAGLDRLGHPVGGASDTVNITYSGAVIPPEGSVVFNEILYSPAIADADFVELFNTHTTATFDLSGWRVNGLDYTFPAGSLLGPQDYLVLVKDPLVFSTVYPDTTIFDAFQGSIDRDGETFTLFRPGALPGEEIVVDRVRYEPGQPWVGATNGSSLQLVDANQDNSRVANWNATNTVSGGGAQSVINITHTWKYNQSGTDLGTAWREPGYNDASWPSGAALLYVENSALPAPKNTLLTIGPRTFYFRTTFNFTGNPAGAMLDLSTVVDDAVIIYLNGQEVFRLGIDGAVTYNTWASRFIGNAVYEGPFNVPALGLVQGENVLAAEVHQSRTGADVCFGMTLEVTPGSITAASPGAPNTVSATLPAFPPLWLNELQTDNVTGPQDNFGERDPWLEIHNTGTTTFNLSGYYLTDTYTNLTKWALPASAAVPAGGFTTIWCDNQTNQTAAGVWHAPFKLASASGTVALVRLVEGQPQVVDYLNYTNVPANWSYGDVPDDQPFYRTTMFYPTPGATNSGASAPLTVFINEWMADNTRTEADPADGGFEDWFEIYNPGTNTVDLGGYYLTDDLTNKFQFEVPDNGHYTIPPGGYLLVWADNESGQNNTNRIDLHANFALSKAGEAVGIFAADGTTIDAVSFGTQTADVSEGRFPNGAAGIYAMTTPTPRAANVVPNTLPDLDPISDLLVTLGQTVSFTAHASDNDTPAQTLTFSLENAPAGAVIQPASGQFTWTPSMAPATNAITVVVTDNGTPSLSAQQTFTVRVVPPPALGAFMLEGANFRFSWPSLNGVQYQVYYKDELEETYWNPLSGVLDGTGAPLWFTNQLDDSPQRFFQLHVLP